MDKGARLAGLGLRRVAYVRIDLSGATPRAQVAGVGQHRPVTLTVPFDVASELVAAGVPSVVHRPRPDERDPVEVG